MLGKGHSSLHTAWTVLLLVTLSLAGRLAQAEEADYRDIDRELDLLQGEVAQLSQELLEFQQATFFPADTRVFLFLSLTTKDSLTPESLEIAIDGRPIVSHLYTPEEKQSLRLGGLQSLYTGNLPLGEHRLDIRLSALAENDRYVRRESSLTFRKRAGEATVEIQLAASAPDFEPSVTLRDWQPGR